MMFYETATNWKGLPVTRLRSSLFYWSALGMFVWGLFWMLGLESLDAEDISGPQVLLLINMLTLFPVWLLLYPLFRAVMSGGRDNLWVFLGVGVVAWVLRMTVFDLAE